MYSEPCTSSSPIRCPAPSSASSPSSRSAPDVDYRDATAADIEWLAPRLRQADVDEVYAASGLGPLVALRLSLTMSERCLVATADGVPVIVFGVQRGSFLSDVGTIWMLGTPQVNRHARELLTDAKDWLGILGEGFGSLENWVDIRNRASIRWLTRMGATFGPAVSFGHSRMLFQAFSIAVSYPCALPSSPQSQLPQ